MSHDEMNGKVEELFLKDEELFGKVLHLFVHLFTCVREAVSRGSVADLFRTICNRNGLFPSNLYSGDRCGTKNTK